MLARVESLSATSELWGAKIIVVVPVWAALTIWPLAVVKRMEESRASR